VLLGQVVTTLDGFFFEAPVLCSFLCNEFSDDISDNGKSERQDGFSLDFVEVGEREVDSCLLSSSSSEFY
jgi:hypothetical protein